MKNHVLAAPIALKAGMWQADGRLYWHNESDLARVKQLFFALYHNELPPPNLFHIRSTAWKLYLRWISRFRILDGTARGPSVAFSSRGGTLKFFDFDNREVITLISGEIADKLRAARTLPLFDEFSTIDFTIDERLRANRDLCIKREPLVEAPCMGMHLPSVQIETMKSISARYANYVSNYSRPPKPELFSQCFEEVSNCLNADARAQFLEMKCAYMDFIRNARTVPAHLDFNVGNFLVSESPILIDIEDSGLCLPATYDANNLLLNEIYQGRPIHLLQATLADPDGIGYVDLLRVALGNSGVAQLGVSLFVNFVLRESRYVSEALLKTWNPKRVPHSWEKFSQSIPGWPLVSHYTSTPREPEILGS